MDKARERHRDKVKPRHRDKVRPVVRASEARAPARDRVPDKARVPVRAVRAAASPAAAAECAAAREATSQPCSNVCPRSVSRNSKQVTHSHLEHGPRGQRSSQRYYTACRCRANPHGGSPFGRSDQPGLLEPRHEHAPVGRKSCDLSSAGHINPCDLLWLFFSLPSRYPRECPADPRDRQRPRPRREWSAGARRQGHPHCRSVQPYRPVCQRWLVHHGGRPLRQLLHHRRRARPGAVSERAGAGECRRHRDDRSATSRSDRNPASHGPGHNRNPTQHRSFFQRRRPRAPRRGPCRSLR